MARKRQIKREVIVQYWHIDEYNTERQIQIIKALAEEADFNDYFVVSNTVDEPNLVCSQLD